MDIQTLSRGKTIQAKDNQSWAFGENAITFDIPYTDNTYTFDASAVGCTVEVVAGTKVTTGLTILVSQDTSVGYWRADGISDIFEQGISSADVVIFKNITLDATALDESTAEQFETGVGKLSAPSTDLSLFSTYPLVEIKPRQGTSIFQATDGAGNYDESINSSGHYKFKLYLANFGTPPIGGGDSKFDLILHVIG